MSEDKNVSKPRQLWDSAVKAVKGGSTEQLVETFTSEMTLVAEGLCEDQNNLRKELAQVREMAEKLEHRADNEQELLDDIALVQRNLDIAQTAPSEQAYLNAMEFPPDRAATCKLGLNCYYPEVRFPL